MSDRRTSPTVEHGRSSVEVKTVDEVAPEQPGPDDVDPLLGVSDAELELLEALNHQLALAARRGPAAEHARGGRGCRVADEPRAAAHVDVVGRGPRSTKSRPALHCGMRATVGDTASLRWHTCRQLD